MNILARVLIQLTIWVNRFILVVQGKEKELEGVDLEQYFDDPEHLIVNLRWFADYRNLFWLFVFYQFCRFIYWVGMQL